MRYPTIMKNLFLCSVIAIIYCSSAFAANEVETVTINNVQYKLFDDYTAILMYDFNSYSSNIINLNIPEKVPGKEEYSIVSVNKYAYSSCSLLESVDAPYIKKLEDGVFYKCENLESVNFDSLEEIGFGTFRNCTKLESVNMPNLLTIADWAFTDCTLLKSVNMPNLLTIEEYAFYGCTSLKSVNMINLSEIGNYAFWNCISLDKIEFNNVSSIGANAFLNCSSLKYLKILNSLPPEIKSGNPFAGVKDCDLYIPFGSKSLYLDEWSNAITDCCFNVKTMDKPDNGKIVVSDLTAGNLMSEIDVNNISNIWQIEISGEMNGSDLLVLNRMNNLEILDMTNCNIVSGGSAYYRDNNTEYFTEDDKLGSYSIRLTTLDSIIYPNVTSIIYELSALRLSAAVVPPTVVNIETSIPCESYIFEPSDLSINVGTDIFKSTKKIYFNRPFESKGQNVFQNVFYEPLEEITFDYPIEELPNWWFQKCKNLPSITLPASVTKIGNSTFNGCSSLKEIICKSSTPPIANASSFMSSTYRDATLYVPEGSVYSYFFDPVWGMFENIKEGAPSGVDEIIDDESGMDSDHIMVFDINGVCHYNGIREGMPSLPHGLYIIKWKKGKVSKLIL